MYRLQFSWLILIYFCKCDLPVHNKTDVISHCVYKWPFFQTLLNVSSFTSNSYIVSINSVRIRSCRVVTIQMKSVSTNSIFPLNPSEVALDVFTQTL